MGQAAGAAIDSQLVLRRLLALLHNILRRASYLALLDEQPAALSRLVDAVVRSAFLAERLATLPLLLDELLDARVAGPLPDRDDFAPHCAPTLAHEDTEAELRAEDRRVGKGCAVSVDLGGSRFIQNKKKTTTESQ